MGIVYPMLQNAIVINNEVIQEGDLKYGTSWDWLMPVIRKIEDGGSDPHELINKALESRSINVVYNEVVSAIERYNNERQLNNFRNYE